MPRPVPPEGRWTDRHRVVSFYASAELIAWIEEEIRRSGRSKTPGHRRRAREGTSAGGLVVAPPAVAATTDRELRPPVEGVAHPGPQGPRGASAGVLTRAETGFVLRQLTAAAPHLVGLAILVGREDFWRVCRDEYRGVDMRVAGWDMHGGLFGVVVAAPPQRDGQRRGMTIDWRTVAAHIADIATRPEM